YKLTLDDSGCIASLYDKRAEREVFETGKLGNELQVYEDFPFNYDAWELSDYYKQKMWLIDDRAVIEPLFDGDRAGFRVTKKYFKSTIRQNIWLYSDNTRIDFENDIDWHEQHQVLKAAFPFDVHSMNTTYEIQFGHVSRPNNENTSWDKAKFEVYGHKWVDMSENGYGIALLNDCKYGHNTEGNTLKLTMLKCATFPNPVADQGEHKFTYSLMPHIGDFREAGVIHEAYSLNQPLEAVEIKANDGKLSDCFSLISNNKENVIIETVKKCEYDDGMIVRMYDAYDRRTTTTVTVADGFKRAYLCDLLENVIEELPFDGNTVKVYVKNFEIVTLKFV
ncbi:MAG: alpha-mannosidase, partial [Clostridia bacterium]|nr:alpha-mannosidase [Clostridia bacterium]